MEKNEIISRINELRKDAGMTHDELVEIIYEARDSRLREIRDEHQENCLMFYFKNGLMVYEVKNRTISEMVELFPDTLREMVKDYEMKDGELGMMVNNNIPKDWACFPMS